MQKKIVNVDNSHNDVLKSVMYFKLRKIKKMYTQNQQELERSTTYDEQKKLMTINNYLREVETDITKHLGTVILK
jgi:DNA primase